MGEHKHNEAQYRRPRALCSLRAHGRCGTSPVHATSVCAWAGTVHVTRALARAQMDFAFSYSSIEHNGLGRYGDPLDPNADLRDMAMLSCIVRPGGAALVPPPPQPRFAV